MRSVFLRRLGAFVFVVWLATTFSGCIQTPQARSAKYLAAGKKLMQKRDAARAILQFKNAVSAMPDDPEVYYQLGNAYAQTGDYVTAARYLQKALDLNPDHLLAQLKMAQLMTATSDQELLKQANERLKQLLRSTLPTTEVLNTLATVELKLGNPGDAIQSLDRALATTQNLGSSILLAKAKLMLKDTQGAERDLLKACADSPKSADAPTVLGEFYVGQRNYPAALAQFQKALELDPKHGPALMDLARLQLTLGKKTEADQNFRRLATFEGYRTIHAIFLFQDGQRDQALREFEKLVRERPNDRGLRTSLILAYRLAGHQGDADKILAKVLVDNPKDLDALQQRAEIALEAGKLVEAEADLSQVVQLKPSEPEVHYLLAKLNQARGSVLTYRQELAETLRLNPNLQRVRSELAHSLLASSGGARAALDLLNTAPPFQKNALAFQVQKNWAYWALGSMPEMRKGIDLGLASERSPDLLIQDGLWKLRSGDPAGARKSVEEALRIDPSDLRALQTLNQTYLVQNQSGLALQKVKEYAANSPKSAVTQDFLGIMLLGQGERTQARAAFVAAKAADPQFVKSDFSLVQLDFLDRKFGDAQKKLETILAANGNNITARLWLGNIEESQGHHDAALAHFQKVVDADPANAQASNNLAYLLAEHGNKPEEALKYAEKAVQLDPQHAAYLDTIGWILYKKGLYTPALGYLQRANSDPKASATWKYHLAMAYAKAGDLDHGRTMLQAALKLNPNFPEAKAAQQIFGAPR